MISGKQESGRANLKNHNREIREPRERQTESADQKDAVGQASPYDLLLSAFLSSLRPFASSAVEYHSIR